MLIFSGDRIYCDETSLVGSIGTKINVNKHNKLLEHYNINVENWSTSDENSILDQLDPTTSTKPNMEQL